MVGTAENPTPWDPDEPLSAKIGDDEHGAHGYQLGCRKPCCTIPHNERIREYRRRQAPGYLNMKSRQNASNRAKTRLAKKYKKEYERLYQEELAKEDLKETERKVTRR